MIGHYGLTWTKFLSIISTADCVEEHGNELTQKEEWMVWSESNPKCHRRRLTFHGYANVKADWTKSSTFITCTDSFESCSHFFRISNMTINYSLGQWLHSFQVLYSLAFERINLFWQCDSSLCLALTGFVKNSDSFSSTKFSSCWSLSVKLKLSGKKGCSSQTNFSYLGQRANFSETVHRKRLS